MLGTLEHSIIQWKVCTIQVIYVPSWKPLHHASMAESECPWHPQSSCISLFGYYNLFPKAYRILLVVTEYRGHYGHTTWYMMQQSVHERKTVYLCLYTQVHEVNEVTWGYTHTHTHNKATQLPWVKWITTVSKWTPALISKIKRKWVVDVALKNILQFHIPHKGTSVTSHLPVYKQTSGTMEGPQSRGDGVWLQKLFPYHT